MTNESLVGAPAPSFTLVASDRHALDALRDYQRRVAGDGVAGPDYVAEVDQAIHRFVGWQAYNGDAVMSPDQAERSATETSVEPGASVETPEVPTGPDAGHQDPTPTY